MFVNVDCNIQVQQNSTMKLFTGLANNSARLISTGWYQQFLRTMVCTVMFNGGYSRWLYLS